MLKGCLLAPAVLSLIAQTPVAIPVEGRIFGPDRKPLAGAVVALVPLGSGSRLAGVVTNRVDSDGHFTLKGRAGKYGLTVTAPGCLPSFQNLELKEVNRIPPMEIRLEKGGHRVQGCLVPAAGKQLEDVRIGFSKVSRDDGDQFFGEIRQGQFDISLAPGNYIAVAEAIGQTGMRRLGILGDLPKEMIQLEVEPSPATPETQAWINRSAIPLKGVEAGKGLTDLRPLKALIGDATVVGLGEATHGTREFFQLKHRMLEFLVSEMGFTVFALEGNMAGALAVDEWVGTGTGDPVLALQGLGFAIWYTEEMLELMRWMRAYNDNPVHLNKLHFYGLDMQDPALAFDQAKVWLDRVDPVEGVQLQTIRERVDRLPLRNSGRRSDADLKAWGAVARDIESLTARLEVRQLAGSAQQKANFRVLAQFAGRESQAEAGTGPYGREESMAGNLRWVQTQEPGAKILLWAHNGHISFNPTSKALNGAPSMGWRLRRDLGPAYLAIGLAFREGGFQAHDSNSKTLNLKGWEAQPQALGTLDAALAATGRQVIALDLRNRPGSGPVADWLSAPQGTWSIGATFAAGEEAALILKEPVVSDYDALLFVSHTTRATPVGLGVDRIRNLEPNCSQTR